MNWERIKKSFRRVFQISVILGMLLLFVGSWMEINFVVVLGAIFVTTPLLAAILFSGINHVKEIIDFFKKV